MTKAADDLTQHHIRPRHGCGKIAGGMDPSPPGFVRVHLTCRACGEAETLDLQTHAMTPERLHRIWRRCASCLSCDLEIVALGAVEDVERTSALPRRGAA